MTTYLFSADHAVSRKLEENATPALMISEERGLFMVTKFAENKEDVQTYKDEFSDAVIIETEARPVSGEDVTAGYFADIYNGKGEILSEQRKALTKEIAKRPLYKDVTQGKLVLVS